MRASPHVRAASITWNSGTAPSRYAPSAMRRASSARARKLSAPRRVRMFARAVSTRAASYAPSTSDEMTRSWLASSKAAASRSADARCTSPRFASNNGMGRLSPAIIEVVPAVCFVPIVAPTWRTSMRCSVVTPAVAEARRSRAARTSPRVASACCISADEFPIANGASAAATCTRAFPSGAPRKPASSPRAPANSASAIDASAAARSRSSSDRIRSAPDATPALTRDWL